MVLRGMLRRCGGIILLLTRRLRRSLRQRNGVNVSKRKKNRQFAIHHTVDHIRSIRVPSVHVVDGSRAVNTARRAAERNASALRTLADK